MNRPELTFEEFCALPLPYTFGLRASGYAVRQYKNAEHGIAKVVNTPFNEKRWSFGIPKVVYFMLDDERNFDTVDQLYVAYMEKACGIEENT